MRLNAKSRKAKYCMALRKTGNSAPNISLNSNEERISQIFGKYGTGINFGQELGFKKNVWKSKEPAHCKYINVILAVY